MSAVAHAAASDCEALVDGILGAWQPANTVSTLAFVAAGAWLVGRARDVSGAERVFALALGAALVAVGVGSVAYHGPGTPAARWLHDLALAAVLVVVVATDVGALRRSPRPLAAVPAVVAAIAAALALVPRTSVPVTAALALAVVGAQVAVGSGPSAPGRTASRAYRLAVVALAGGATVDLLSGTGAPLCRPGSLLQGHALWHVAAAVGTAAWGCSALRHPAVVDALRR